MRKPCALGARDECGLSPAWPMDLDAFSLVAPLLLLLLQRRAMTPLHGVLDGASPSVLGQPSRSWCRGSGFTMSELGLEFGPGLCQQRWPELIWLGFVMNSGDSLGLLTGSKSITASSCQCTASVLARADIFLI